MILFFANLNWKLKAVKETFFCELDPIHPRFEYTKNTRKEEEKRKTSIEIGRCVLLKMAKYIFS